MSWDKVVDLVTPLVFRVYAGESAGTAFVISVSNQPHEIGHGAILATASHVLAASIDTAEKVQFVSADKRNVFNSDVDEIRVQTLGHEAHDTMLIMLKSRNPILNQADLMPMLPFKSMLARGADVGILGFPGLVEPELCFFHGYVSGYILDPPIYLIDGVAINGVSGGPVFDDRAHIIGLVSAYIPNRIDTQTTLPGLMALVPINTIRYFMEHNMGASVL